MSSLRICSGEGIFESAKIEIFLSLVPVSSPRSIVGFSVPFLFKITLVRELLVRLKPCQSSLVLFLPV